MGALRNYQSEAVQKIMDFYDSEEIKAKLYIGNGLGRNRIAATAIEKIILNDPSCSVMVVFRSITECEQFYSMLTSKAIECSIVNRTRETNSKVQICSFRTLDNESVQIDDFDLVVDFDSKGIDESDINRSEYRKQHPTRFITFIGIPEVEGDLYKDATCIFSYSYTDAISDGYDTELSGQNVERILLCQIFPTIGLHFSYEQQEKLATYYLRPDMIMEKDGEYYLVEIKYYRSRQYSSENLKQVIKQMCYYRSVIKENGLSQYKGFVVIMLCQVKDSVIHEVYEQYGITIWDIRNLFYLCQDSTEAKKALEIILPSPIGQIVPSPPLEI